MQQGVDRLFGPHLLYNTLDDTGAFEQPGFLMQRALPAHGSAEHMEFLGKDRYRFSRATFTTARPQGRLAAGGGGDRARYEAERGQGEESAPALLDHTLIAAPFASFPLENRRRSGILAPYYSHTSTRGLEVGVPYLLEH